MNVQAILEWSKSNIWIIVFVVLMIAALVGLPMVASGMNADVRKKVEERAANLAKLDKLQKTDLGNGQTGLVNEAFLQRYERATKLLSDDAKAVQKAAIEHNRKEGRDVVLAGVLPEIPGHLRDVRPKRFHEALVAEYDNLLAEIGAGTPPSLESMRDELHRARNIFITQDLKKASDEKLEPEEEKLLREKLTTKRMSLYAEAAEKVNIYATIDQLRVPQWRNEIIPSDGQLYNWQWQLWITQDILRALHAINKPHQSVTRAPVKHLIDLRVHDLPAPVEETAAPSMAAGGGFGTIGRSGGKSPSSDNARNASPSASPPGAPNYAISITGRTSNALYDVVYVDLVLVVETAKIPQVLDALSQYNFMTVTALRLDAADAFKAVESGFLYGAAPVSTLSMTIETIWLRQWMQPFMPNSIRRALGVPLPPAGQPGASST